MKNNLLFRALVAAVGVLANVEKAIFLGPASVSIPAEPPTLDNLRLDTLKPQQWSLRTRVKAQFPTADHERGKATWLLLDDLTEGQRYEVRVCWPATQPTAFTLTTHTLDSVWETPELITSLNEYSQSRNRKPLFRPLRATTQPRESSLLFLQILAAADYYTNNQTLMSKPPGVSVDIILDPFLLNVLPRSLLPTVCWIVVVAVVSVFMAKGVVGWLRRIVDVNMEEGESEKKTQ